MREIKFRAWDEQNNEWMYAGLKNEIRRFPLTVSNPLSLCLDDRFGDKYENTVWCLNNDELIWCQYTGLKDKNGLEIYEGDILAGCNGSINGTGWNWGNYSISFKDGKFDVPLWGTLEHHDSTHWFEVIGNIYEHGYLLDSNS